MSDAVRIDVRPYVAAELEGRLLRDPTGKPILEPGPTANLSDSTRWVIALNRLLGKSDGPLTVRVVVERPKAARGKSANSYL